MMTGHTIEGNVWTFGTDIDTDTIIPGQYMDLDPETYCQHAMEPITPDFAQKIDASDIIVAETNFGIGSSREHAAIALKEVGIGAILAKSFGRIFYRNAINQGLPVLEIDQEVIDAITEGDRIQLNVFKGTLVNKTTGDEYNINQLTDPQRSILQEGGAVEYYSNR